MAPPTSPAASAPASQGCEVPTFEPGLSLRPALPPPARSWSRIGPGAPAPGRPRSPARSRPWAKRSVQVRTAERGGRLERHQRWTRARVAPPVAGSRRTTTLVLPPLLEVRIEDRFAGRAPARLPLQVGTATVGAMILQATSTAICVVRKSLILQKRVFDPGCSRSANTPSAEGLSAVGSGR
jgi:hypothetical protein